MLRYIFKRVLIFVPTLLVISLLTFAISVNAPGDPLELLNKNSLGEGRSEDKLASEKTYREARHTYGFDLPLFYFTISSAAYPDTLYKVADESQRKTLERLSWKYGDWNYVSNWYLQLRTLEVLTARIPPVGANAVSLNTVRNDVYQLYDQFEERKICFFLKEISTVVSDSGSLHTLLLPAYQNLQQSFEDIQVHATPYRKYVPAISWYGTANQYHRWLSRFLQGDFGISYQDQRPVSSVIGDALPWTAGISLLSVILAYLIAIPIGIHAAVNKGRLSERIGTSSLFVLYSLPNFWIATMLVIFLCGGDWLHVFPGPGAAPVPDDASLLVKIGTTSYRLILPLICWTYGSLAFISRQMRGGMLNVISQDYIRTARAKGLDEHTVIWKHALRNSLLPVITLFGEIFPLAVSGSVVLEHIFNIPGMGQLSYEALFSKNYPVIFAVLLITAFLTLLGNLVADIGYALVDPRISYSGKKK